MRLSSLEYFFLSFLALPLTLFTNLARFRIMTLCLFAALFVVSSKVNGLVYNAPRSTAVAEGQAWDSQGWTPAPTRAPKSPFELKHRALLQLQGRQESVKGTTVLVGEDEYCGYLSGAAGKLPDEYPRWVLIHGSSRSWVHMHWYFENLRFLHCCRRSSLLWTG